MVQIPHALELTSPCMMVPFNLIRDKQFLYTYIRSVGGSSRLVRPNLTLSTIQLNVWVANNFTTAGIPFLLVIL